MLLVERLVEMLVVSMVAGQWDCRPSEKRIACLAASCAPEMQQCKC